MRIFLNIFFAIIMMVSISSCTYNNVLSNDMPIIVTEIAVSSENNVSRGSINMNTRTVKIVYDYSEATKTPKRFLVGDTLTIVSTRYIRELENNYSTDYGKIL